MPAGAALVARGERKPVAGVKTCADGARRCRARQWVLRRAQFPNHISFPRSLNMRTGKRRVRNVLASNKDAVLAGGIVRAPIAGDPAAEVPREAWDQLMFERRRFCTQYLPKDCRSLICFIEDAAKNDWMGYGSREQYISDGLGLDLEMVEWGVAGLRTMRPTEAATFDEMVVLGKQKSFDPIRELQRNIRHGGKGLFNLVPALL